MHSKYGHNFQIKFIHPGHSADNPLAQIKACGGGPMPNLRFSALLAGAHLLITIGLKCQTQKATGVQSAVAASAVNSIPIHVYSPSTGASTSVGVNAVVPRLMKFQGVLLDAAGKPMSGTVDVTFVLYSSEAGGSPLWFETQSVHADELGRYTTLLGAMHPDGLPIDLFMSGEARWLGIQVGTEEEEQQPRVLLVSVPYALKAGDAETLGGKPASAYALSDSGDSTTSINTMGSASGSTVGSVARREKPPNTPFSIPTPPADCTNLSSVDHSAMDSIAAFSTPCERSGPIRQQSADGSVAGPIKVKGSLSVTETISSGAIMAPSLTSTGPLALSSGGTNQNITLSPGGTVNGPMNVNGNLTVSGTSTLFGTVTGPIHDRGGQVFNVQAYGAKGDCRTDDAPAIRATIGAAESNLGWGVVYFPAPVNCYLLGSSLGTIPMSVTLRGAGREMVVLQRHFNGGALLTMADSTEVEDLQLEGDGANYAGEGIDIGGIDSNQTIKNVRIVNFNGIPVHYLTTTAGSRSTWINVEARSYRGSGYYAFVTADGVQPTAVPKSYFHIETGGQPAFEFGGDNDVFICNSFIGDLQFTKNTSGVNIVSSRIATMPNLHILGQNSSLVGDDIYPNIILDSGAAGITVGPGSNNGTITDNSRTFQNKLFFSAVPYTPTLTSGGIAPALGNGTIAGAVSRVGTITYYNIEFTVGSTTTLGSGDLRFGLPNSPVSGNPQSGGGSAVIYLGGKIYIAAAQVPGAVGYVDLLRDLSGSVTYNSPGVFGPGDTIRISGWYYM
jgi:Pectate lyase superfamily protein